MIFFVMLLFSSLKLAFYFGSSLSFQVKIPIIVAISALKTILYYAKNERKVIYTIKSYNKYSKIEIWLIVYWLYSLMRSAGPRGVNLLKAKDCERVEQMCANEGVMIMSWVLERLGRTRGSNCIHPSSVWYFGLVLITVECTNLTLTSPSFSLLCFPLEISFFSVLLHP